MRTSFAHSHCSFAVGIFCCEGIDVSAMFFCSWLFSVETTYALNLVFVEVWDHADDDPGQTAAEVHGLVHDEAHDTGGERVVTDVGVPRGPHALEVVEVDIVL